MAKRIILEKNSLLVECEESERGIEYYFNSEKIDRFDLLACAARAKSREEAWECLHLASSLFHPQDDETFNVLYGEVAIGVTHTFYENEFTIQKVFKDNVEKILGLEYHLLKEKKNNPKHIPDAWVTFEGYEIPVEVKYGKFDKKALKQLERYMKVYKCKMGIAIGNVLEVNIPKNIKFVSIPEIKEVVANEK